MYMQQIPDVSPHKFSYQMVDEIFPSSYVFMFNGSTPFRQRKKKVFV